MVLIFDISSGEEEYDSTPAYDYPDEVLDAEWNPELEHTHVAELPLESAVSAEETRWVNPEVFHRDIDTFLDEMKR